MLQNSSGIDLRVRRTRKLLRDALINLIDQDGFDNISVTQLADLAMINRVTFYRHYRDKYDLLAHCMDDVFEELEIQAKPPVRETGEIDHTAPVTNLALVFDHIRDNADFYRVMLGKDGAAAFVSRLRDVLRQISERRWHQMTRGAVNGTMPTDMVMNFISSAYIGVILWWVENDCPNSSEEMANTLVDLTLNGPYQALGLKSLLS